MTWSWINCVVRAIELIENTLIAAMEKLPFRMLKKKIFLPK